MNQERVYKVLLGPHFSEKASIVADQSNQFVFRVSRDASKPEIKEAVEQLFEVKVKSVSTLNVKGKTKRFGRSEGKRASWKKAYVALQAGYDIDFVDGEVSS